MQKKKGWRLAAGAGVALAAALTAFPAFAQEEQGPSRYVDHSTAVKMGGVGNYVTPNELQAYEARQELQNDIKHQLKAANKSLTLPSDQTVVFFNTGQDKLTPQGKKEIQRIAEQVKGDRSLVAVVGAFTDNTGSKASNEKLSHERAKTVENELKDLGVSSRQIRAEGLGESEPIASNASDEGRSMNRRAEIYVQDFKSTIG